MYEFMKYQTTFYEESLEESSAIIINKTDVRLIKYDEKLRIEHSIEKVKAFVISLDDKDYDRQEIIDDMVDTIKKDPEHDHKLKIINNEIRAVITDHEFIPSCIIFADFECSTDQKIHK